MIACIGCVIVRERKTLKPSVKKMQLRNASANSRRWIQTASSGVTEVRETRTTPITLLSERIGTAL